MSKYVIPAATAERLEVWLKQRNELNALIEMTVLTMREALGVPADWVLNDLAQGFVAPKTVPEQFTPAANGNDAQVEHDAIEMGSRG